MKTRELRYSAFISYNHADRPWAKWLHRRLEAFAVPLALRGRETAVGTIGAKLPRVFRDRDELAASRDLSASVLEALAASAALIVICSPNGAQSRWVNEEIRAFAGLGRAHRIFCVIVEGEPNSSDPAKQCLPAAILELVSADPLAADVRATGDGKSAASLKLIAAILDLPYDDLYRREARRRQKRLGIIASVLGAGLLLTTSLAVIAYVARNEAVKQRDIARERTRTAERTVSFVKSLFENSDPSNARGSDITAREVVDSGARKIRNELQDQPAVRADLAATLAQVYGSLGYFKESEQLAGWSFSLRHGDADVRARQLLSLADARMKLGNLDGAKDAAAQAAAIARTSSTLPPEILSRALLSLGEANANIGDAAAARKFFEEAYRRDVSLIGPDNTDAAIALEGLGAIAIDEGDLNAASKYIENALAIRRKYEGEMSPSVSDDIAGLARIATKRGDSAVAETLYKSRLAITAKVLGTQHPDYAKTLNDLARAIVEQRRFGEAIEMLGKASAILAAKGLSQDHLAGVIETNRGLAYAGLEDKGRAAASFQRALDLTGDDQDPVTAVALVQLADVKCQSGAPKEALRLLDRARPITMALFEAEPWRMAWLDTVRGSCLWAAGDRKNGQKLVRDNAAAMFNRWRTGSLFAVEAQRKLAAVNAP